MLKKPTKKEFKLIIFDLDGVVVSTDQHHFQAWARSLKEILQLEIPEEDKDLVRGIPRRDSLMALLNKHHIELKSEEKIQEILKLKNQFYVDLLANLEAKEIKPGFLELIKFAQNQNIEIALASSSRNAKLILNKLKIANIFDYIVNIDLIKVLKPHPDIFLQAAQALNVKPTQAIVVEDAQSGIEAAKSAKMFAIAFGKAQDLEGYDLKVTSHNQIIDWLKENI